MIKENTNLLVAASVELDSWSTLNKQFALQEIWSHPYVLGGSNVVKQVRQWAKRKSITSMIEYVFEDGDEGKGELDKWCRDQIGVAPIFRSKLEAIPCQAADLIAWKNRITMLGIRKLKKSGDDEGMEQILKSLSTVAVRPTSGAIFSSAEIMRMCREIPIPERSSMMP